MPKYQVEIDLTPVTFHVEAECEREAEDKAMEQLIHQRGDDNGVFAVTVKEESK